MIRENSAWMQASPALSPISPVAAPAAVPTAPSAGPTTGMKLRNPLAMSRLAAVVPITEPHPVFDPAAAMPRFGPWVRTGFGENAALTTLLRTGDAWRGEAAGTETDGSRLTVKVRPAWSVKPGAGVVGV